MRERSFVAFQMTVMKIDSEERKRLLSCWRRLGFVLVFNLRDVYSLPVI